MLACGVSIVVLAYNPDPPARSLESLDQLDKSILNELDRFNIPNDQIHSNTVHVNDQFSRKNYRVEVAPSFSKTQFHYELQQQLWPLGIQLPAELSLPYNEMRIHLYLDHTVVRSIRLQTDPDMASSSNPVSMMVVTAPNPPDALIHQMVQMAEPIPLVVPVTSPLEAREIHGSLSNRYHPLIFWIRTSNRKDMFTHTSPAKVEKLAAEYRQVMPEATYLVWNRSAAKLSPELIKKLAESRLDFVYLDGENQFHLNNTDSFDAELQKIQADIQQGKNPMLILPDQSEAVDDIYNRFLELKKKGVQIVAPPTHDF